MNIEEQKKAAAEKALDYLPHDGILGVGTGSTANYFIEIGRASCRERV